MVFQVRLFLGGELVAPPDYRKLIITNPAVDQIVNDICGTGAEAAYCPSAPACSGGAPPRSRQSAKS